jgi:hypothetical protein
MATDESLAQLLQQLLDKVDVDLEDAHSLLRAAQGRVGELETEKAGLTLALKRYDSGLGAVDLRASAGTTVGDLGPAEARSGFHPELAAANAQESNADRTYKGLKALGRPASRLEVRDRVAAGDPEFDSEKTRNALNYLVKKGLVKRQPSGLWEVVVEAAENDSPPASAASVNGVSEAGHVEAARPAPARSRRVRGRAGARKPPVGKVAALEILKSDESRFWTVREVWDEQVRRGWAQPRPRGTKGNPPSRLALMRLREDYPDNVARIDEPLMAFKWSSSPVLTLVETGQAIGEGAAHHHYDDGRIVTTQSTQG